MQTTLFILSNAIKAKCQLEPLASMFLVFLFLFPFTLHSAQVNWIELQIYRASRMKYLSQLTHVFRLNGNFYDVLCWIYLLSMTLKSSQQHCCCYWCWKAWRTHPLIKKAAKCRSFLSSLDNHKMTKMICSREMCVWNVERERKVNGTTWNNRNCRHCQLRLFFVSCGTTMK